MDVLWRRARESPVLSTSYPAGEIQERWPHIAQNIQISLRHARTCSGHPRLAYGPTPKEDVDGRNKCGHDGELYRDLPRSFPTMPVGKKYTLAMNKMTSQSSQRSG